MSKQSRSRSQETSTKGDTTPRLRFPEFRENGAWRRSTLKDEVKILKGRGISKSDLEADGATPCVRYAELYTSYTEVIDEILSFTDASPEDLMLSEVGDVLIPASGESKDEIATATCVEQDGVALGGDLNVLRSEINGAFLSYYLNGSKRRDFARVAQGGTVTHLYPSQVEQVDVAIPSDVEQLKIADFLKSLASLVRAESSTLSAVRAHKKGLLQQLFPSADHHAPRTRVQRIDGSSRWRVKRGSELFDKRDEKGKDGLPLYSVTVDRGMVERSTIDRNFSDITDPSGNRVARAGDLAYNTMRMWQGACGVAPVDCMVSPAYVILEPKPGVNSKFFAYYFSRPDTLRLLTAYSRGLTKDRLRLYFDDFSDVPLLVPGEEEQEKIVDILLSVDDLIAAQSARVAALKAHKQGLLQQLFPKPDDGGAA